MINKQKHLGQVWTPKAIIKQVLALITIVKPQLVLEPAAGSGRFYFLLKKLFPNVIGIEIDPQVAKPPMEINDYFATNYQPDLNITNPPYVAFKEITNKPVTKLLIHKPNLYHYFLEKALNDLKDDGQLIWIVPADIFTNSSAKYLNQLIDQNYSITYWQILPETIWDNALITTAILRIEKTINHPDKLKYCFINGKIIFGQPLIIDQKVIVKVGGVSGHNALLKAGNVAFVNSKTIKTKQPMMIDYQVAQWIRPTPAPPNGFTYQIFVNCKSRNARPFYLLDWLNKGQFINYDGSLLCIYTFSSKAKTQALVDQLNNYDWSTSGIKRSGRFHFSQSILKSIIKNA